MKINKLQGLSIITCLSLAVLKYVDELVRRKYIDAQIADKIDQAVKEHFEQK